MSSMESFFYKMDHQRRGQFVIINNRTFQEETELTERSGTDIDANCLQADFTRLGFEVQRHDNQTKTQMRSIMMSVAEGDHSQCDAFGVVFLSHGEDGLLYGSDGPIEIESLLEPLKACGTLTGKPKIVLIQACRGENFDMGVTMTDTTTQRKKRRLQMMTHLPREADFLFAYSTVSGYVSYRWGDEGSWFIQALHEVLKDPGIEDLVDVLLRVNNLVAIKCQTENAAKQMPCIISTLRKKLYLRTAAPGDIVINIDFPSRGFPLCDEHAQQPHQNNALLSDAYGVLRHFHLIDVELTNESGQGVRWMLSWQQFNRKPLRLGSCSAEYRRCDYSTPDGKLLPVFVAAEVGPPPGSFRSSGYRKALHLGISHPNFNGPPSVFFVIHPKEWMPFQHRFIADFQTNTMHEEIQRILGSNFLFKHCTTSLIGKFLLYLG